MSGLVRARLVPITAAFLLGACQSRDGSDPGDHDGGLDVRGGGAFLVYNKGSDGHKHLFRSNYDGTGEIQLTDDAGILTNDNPFFSPDGSFVGYAHGDPGAQLTSLERVPASGGSRVRLIEGLGEAYSSAWGG